MNEKYTIEPSRYDNSVTVYEWGVYPRSSVLAGQTRKQFVDSYEDQEEALKAYPGAEIHESRVSAHNTFHHLEDEDGNLGPSPHDLSYGIDPFSGEALE